MDEKAPDGHEQLIMCALALHASHFHYALASNLDAIKLSMIKKIL
jgi:hypothetical protein